MTQTAAGSGSGGDTTQQTMTEAAYEEWAADARADHAISSDTEDGEYEVAQSDSDQQHRQRRKGERPARRKKRPKTILDDTDSGTDSDNTGEPPGTQHGPHTQRRYDGTKKKKRKK